MRKAVAAALVDNGKVLMQQRDVKPDVTMPGRWCLPGGVVEEDETPKQAIKREFFEETGYQLKNPQLLAKDFYTVNDRKTVGYIFYEVYDGKQKIECQEGQKMEFKSQGELSKLKVIPRHDKFASEAINLSQN